jgi:MarR family transcriptional regulator, organic hydroperoxide resistance regulator
MDNFQEVANKIAIYKIRSAWLAIAKLYNDMASQYDGTLSESFVLLAIDDKDGTPVTKIAPRMGMEPNSLSRILKSMEKKGAIYRKDDPDDQRRVIVCLTEMGRTLREIALKAVFQLEKTIIRNQSPEKMDTFFEVIDSVPEAVSTFKEQIKGREQ